MDDLYQMIEDSLDQIIEDTIDMDWTSRWAARAIVEKLKAANPSDEVLRQLDEIFNA